MTELVCKQFDEFAEALRGVDGRYLLTARASRHWGLRMVELPGVSLMQGQDGAANLFQAACQPRTCSLFVPLGGSHGLSVNGVPMQAGDAAWLTPHAEFHMRTGAAQQWLAVMLGPSDSCLQGIGHEANGMELPATPRIGSVPRLPMARLLTLSYRILLTAGQHACGSRAAQLMADGLAEAAFRVVATLVPQAQHRHQGRPLIRRQVVLRRALDLIEYRLDHDNVDLTELSQAAGVSKRTLQAIFQEQLGLSPHQFIIIRRLHAIHAALRVAIPGDTVSGICARFGVWDFGRFAHAYHMRFGSTPSAVLANRQTPEVHPRLSRVHGPPDIRFGLRKHGGAPPNRAPTHAPDIAGMR
jgi:AraC family ethanolamine operon transcriptional activator